MSAKSDALKTAMTDYIQARTARGAAPDARARVVADRAFARLAALVAPRIRYFTRSYGLADVTDDAAQVCAIALHRAAERYDPALARITTYVNWQLRAKLQELRFRLHGNQRSAGRRACHCDAVARYAASRRGRRLADRSRHKSRDRTGSGRRPRGPRRRPAGRRMGSAPSHHTAASFAS
ncbi:hypothetical protein [Sphingopyxis sp.]|uniref:hypothetical protein n=1 Tax=Sphingopyxis sp. TaxID=1908224 RepID=UPI0025ED8DF5|nr:hypothetical protein [Sphingopyxis sp.]